MQEYFISDNTAAIFLDNWIREKITGNTPGQFCRNRSLEHVYLHHLDVIDGIDSEINDIAFYSLSDGIGNVGFVFYFNSPKHIL